MSTINTKEFEAYSRDIHILFPAIRGTDPLPKDVGFSLSTVSSLEEFCSQFNMITCKLFEGWSSEGWSNVIVAGGATLAAVLPIDPRFKRLGAPPSKTNWVEFNFDATRNGRIINRDHDDRTK